MKIEVKPKVKVSSTATGDDLFVILVDYHLNYEVWMEKIDLVYKPDLYFMGCMSKNLGRELTMNQIKNYLANTESVYKDLKEFFILSVDKDLESNMGEGTVIKHLIDKINKNNVGFSIELTDEQIKILKKERID